MDSPAFTTPFSGAKLLPRRRPALTPRYSRNSSAPSAILDSRTSTSSFGTTQPAQTYSVKVMQKNRCTVIEVERDTDLRSALLDSKIDVYTLGGKLRNCGGGGQCGTCLIDVEEGLYSMNGRTGREERLLEDKPDSWRLACRTMIYGDCTIRTKPQA